MCVCVHLVVEVGEKAAEKKERKCPLRKSPGPSFPVACPNEQPGRFIFILEGNELNSIRSHRTWLSCPKLSFFYFVLNITRRISLAQNESDGLLLILLNWVFLLWMGEGHYDIIWAVPSVPRPFDISRQCNYKVICSSVG